MKNRFLSSLKPIALPFLVSRLLLLLTGYLTPLFLPLSYKPDALIAARGWLFSPQRFIDMFSRWDSGWYLTIATEGYRLVENVYSESNLAFFPMYPFIVKVFLAIFPKEMVSTELILLIGIVVSNVFFVGSLIFLYKIAFLVFHSKSIASRSIWLLALFPSSFFLSSFYTESTFLFLSLLVFWLALSKRWKLAVLFSIFLGLTRLVGVLIVLPLAILFWQNQEKSVKERVKEIIITFAVVPSGLLVFVAYLYSLTGDVFALFKVQAAWNKQLTDPLQSLFFPSGSWWYLTPFDQVAMVTSIATSFSMIRTKMNRLLLPFGLYSLLIISPVLLTGTLDSASRFIVVAFPLFMYWSWLLERHKKVDLALKVVFVILQILYFGLFSQFYWAG